MSSETAIADEQQRLLTGLAELSLAVAREVQAAVMATDDTAEMVSLATAFTKVGRCLRMAIALSARLARGETVAPVREQREDSHVELEAERDESEFLEERPERLDDHENLYDRLPPGDVGTQIVAIARTLGAAARNLPAPMAQAYKARCDALVARTTADLPEPEEIGHPPHGATVVVLNAHRAPPHSRGPPPLN